MTRRKKRNKNLEMPRDREEQFVKEVQNEVKDLLISLTELEGDDEVIESIACGISELGDVIEALAYQSGVPKKLKRPWNLRDMN